MNDFYKPLDGKKQLQEMMNDTPTPRTDEWETYCDECYYHFWRLRRKTERGWYDGFHIHTGEEAKGLCDLLNKLETELAAVIEQRDAASAEFYRYHGLWDRATKQLETVMYQRDRLAEALEEIKRTEPANHKGDLFYPRYTEDGDWAGDEPVDPYGLLAFIYPRISEALQSLTQPTEP